MIERDAPGREHAQQETERLDALLAALGSAQPDAAFEQRLLRRLAAAPVRPSRLLRVTQALRPQRVLAGAGVAVAVCVAGVLVQHGRSGRFESGARDSQRTSAAALHQQRRATQPPSASHRPDPLRTGVGADTPATEAHTASQVTTAELRFKHGNVTPTPVASCASAPCRREPARYAEATLDANGVGAAHNPSFPAPPMPLTEQERLLLRIAHRDDPVQLAMLDPVERNLQLQRERAESARFFAPPKLPPDLQEQIDAALRSQYINTPPPRELLAQTTDRSNP